MFHKNEHVIVRQVASAKLPTRWGEFRILGFERDLDEAGWRQRQSAVALVKGDLTSAPPLLRIHSQCLTGDVFGSLRCDCGKQLDMAMSKIAEAEGGLIIYEPQEGRGIGLISKLLAYEHQDSGADTVEANERLGLKNDYRDFSFAIQILNSLCIRQVKLLSNNPEKGSALHAGGIQVVARVSCEVEFNCHAEPYLRAKKEKLGHLLTLDQAVSTECAPHRRRAPKPLSRATRMATPIRSRPQFANIDAALEEIRQGRMVIVVDDESRENEGDLTIAAEKVTPDAINFMAQFARGLICLSLTPERVGYLRLAPMVHENTSHYTTAFTQSIDVIGRGTSTGISAYDRTQTILAALDPATRPVDLARPGHIFPLEACKGGVLTRPGHTEASVDLARLAGLAPSGVICEIMNRDGSMARMGDLHAFAKHHQIKILTIAELVRYRTFHEGLSFKVEPAMRAAK